MKQTLAMLFADGAAALLARGLRGEERQHTANGPSTGTTDNGAADSGKKKDNVPGRRHGAAKTKKTTA